MSARVGWVSVARALAIELDLDPRVTHHYSDDRVLRPDGGLRVDQMIRVHLRSTATLTHPTFYALRNG
jgi:hypothetical protein